MVVMALKHFWMENEDDTGNNLGGIYHRFQNQTCHPDLTNEPRRRQQNHDNLSTSECEWNSAAYFIGRNIDYFFDLSCGAGCHDYLYHDLLMWILKVLYRRFENAILVASQYIHVSKIRESQK